MGEAADGLGTILTGSAVAREADRGGHGGVANAGHGAEGAGGACLNCGAIRAGGFCQDCGQSGHVHRTVAALGHDLAHGVFHFEGKLWATLPLLVRAPGDLTRRYVHGERARFVSPMALFLFSVFLLFAAVSRVTMPDVAGAGQAVAKAQDQVSRQIDQAGDRLEALREKRADRLSDNPKADVAAIDGKIVAETKLIAGLRSAASRLPRTPGEAARAAAVTAGDTSYAFNMADGVKQIDVDTGFAPLDRQIAHVKANPDLYAYKLKTASYKFSWALIPISVPFIWLLFCWRRDVGIYDHAIFATYSLSFMTLLVVGLLGLSLIGVGAGWLWTAAVVVPPIHMWKQLRGAYRIGRFGATWRTLVLLVSTTIAGGLFLALLLWLEAD